MASSEAEPWPTCCNRSAIISANRSCPQVGNFAKLLDRLKLYEEIVPVISLTIAKTEKNHRLKPIKIIWRIEKHHIQLSKLRQTLDNPSIALVVIQTVHVEVIQILTERPVGRIKEVGLSEVDLSVIDSPIN